MKAMSSCHVMGNSLRKKGMLYASKHKPALRALGVFQRRQDGIVPEVRVKAGKDIFLLRVVYGEKIFGIQDVTRRSLWRSLLLVLHGVKLALGRRLLLYCRAINEIITIQVTQLTANPP